MYQYLLELRTGIARDNLSQSKIKNITVVIPPLPIQQQLVKEIEILEAQIATAQNVIDNAAAQKQAILKKWLE
jgi:restriction endonuclease S subunit